MKDLGNNSEARCPNCNSTYRNLSRYARYCDTCKVEIMNSWIEHYPPSVLKAIIEATIKNRNEKEWVIPACTLQKLKRN